MAKIFIGIPEHKPWKEFEESLSQFLPEVKKEHEIEVYRVKGKTLVDAQNDIANKFLASDKDYLLFLEEDHWGHTLEMLNKLIIADTYICAIKYYSRHPGRLCCLLQYTGLKNYEHRYKELPHNEGFQQCDLVPFGMTLIKRELFDKIEEPYFRVNDYYFYEQKDCINKATDQNFCERIIKAGIKPVGCFDHTLMHRGIDETNYKDFRKQDILDSFVKVKDKVMNFLTKRINMNRKFEYIKPHSISELKNFHLGEDIYVLGSGSSLDYIDSNFFDDKVVISNNTMYKLIDSTYVLAHHHNVAQEALDEGQIVITSEYDRATYDEPYFDELEGDPYIYRHANQNHMGKVDLRPLESDDSLMCCSSTMGTSIHLAYHLGAKNIIVCGLDSGTIDGKYYVDGYIKDEALLSSGQKNHIKITDSPVIDIVNAIRKKDVNVIGFNPFVTLDFEGHKFDK